MIAISVCLPSDALSQVPTILLGFLLPWTWGISSQLLQQSAAAAPYFRCGVAPGVYSSLIYEREHRCQILGSGSELQTSPACFTFCFTAGHTWGVKVARRKVHWRRQLVSGGHCFNTRFLGAVRVTLAVFCFFFLIHWSKITMIIFCDSVVSSVISASLLSWLWQIGSGDPIFNPHFQFFWPIYIISWFDCFPAYIIQSDSNC